MVDGDLLFGRLIRHVKHLRHYLVRLLVTLLGVTGLSLDSLLEANKPLVRAFTKLDRSANTWTPYTLCHVVVLLFFMQILDKLEVFLLNFVVIASIIIK